MVVIVSLFCREIEYDNIEIWVNIFFHFWSKVSDFLGPCAYPYHGQKIPKNNHNSFWS